ncbi:hypothetical protein Tco_0311802 [Tanacetum coccineum]
MDSTKSLKDSVQNTVAFDLLRDALSAIFGLSELKLRWVVSLIEWKSSVSSMKSSIQVPVMVQQVQNWTQFGGVTDWYQSQASDENIEEPMKDQPLYAGASPTALSPGYIANFDPEEDKEDPEEDPADHPADG